MACSSQDRAHSQLSQSPPPPASLLHAELASGLRRLGVRVDGYGGGGGRNGLGSNDAATAETMRGGGDDEDDAPPPGRSWLRLPADAFERMARELAGAGRGDETPRARLISSTASYLSSSTPVTCIQC